MRISPNDLVADLQAQFTDPKLRDIAMQLGVKSAMLTARALIGENVDAELSHIRAQSSLLTSEEVMKVRTAVLDWLTGAITKVAVAALAT